MPDLAAVDPTSGSRITGDPLTRVHAAAGESWRRLAAEPTPTPYRAKRVIALARVRNALEVLTQELARGDKRRVKLAFDDLSKLTKAFKALQRRARVAGDNDILPAEFRQQIKDFLTARRPDGNAAKLDEFVADGPVWDHAELMRQVVRALGDSGMR
jgi:hypothetical protein